MSSLYSPLPNDTPATTKKRIAAALASIAGAETNFSLSSPAYVANNQDQGEEMLRRINSALAAIADARTSRNSVQFVSAGDAQVSTQVLGAVTTGTTPVELTTNGQAVNGTTNLFLIPNNAVQAVRVAVTATTAAGALVGHYVREAVIRNDAGAVSLVGSVGTIGSDITDAGASSWSVAVTADAVNKGLKIVATGAAATTVHWVARLDVTQTAF